MTTAVWALDESDEAIRDLSRAREDAIRSVQVESTLAGDAAADGLPLLGQDAVDGGAWALSFATVVCLASLGFGVGEIPSSG